MYALTGVSLGVVLIAVPLPKRGCALLLCTTKFLQRLSRSCSEPTGLESQI